MHYFSCYLLTGLVSSNSTARISDASEWSYRSPSTSACVPLRTAVCHRHRVGYTHTSLPNSLGRADQEKINQELVQFDKLVGVKCYPLLPLFLCSIYAPKCVPLTGGAPIPPCRSLCHACGADGFRCDYNRCVPRNWVCDGFIDCQDGSDEKNCSYCSYDEYHCGSGVCIRKEDICDGIRDCPDGRDERQCLRLNKWMRKSIGEGRLEAYSAVTNSWKIVCGEDWDASFMSHRACIRLGYRKANQTWIKEESLVPVPSSRSGDALPGPGTKRFFNKGRLGLNRSCEKTQVSVHLTCSNFECGKTAISYEPSSRIVGGKESLPGSWPWLVGLHGGDDEVFFCGGVLVSEHWVLTAAHCVGNQTNAKGWSVHLGLTRRTASPVFVRRRNVSAIIKHEDFNVKHLFGNDIALLLLSEPVNFDEFLRPVCLPPKDLDLTPETRCTVIGWGKSKHDEMSDYLNVIHEVEVPIVHHSVCAKWYSLQEVPIGDTTLCAGYPEGEKDACQGDSGGPLLCPSSSSGQWFVAGIVSWGINCAQPNLPGIYTKVNIYRDWISNTSSTFDLPIDLP